MEGLISPGLPSKFTFCQVNAFKTKNTVEHDVNSVLKDFRNYYSPLAANLVKMLPKITNKYSINTVIKYYEHMNLGDYFNLAPASKNLILTILKVTQVSKAAGTDNLSGCFLKNGTKVLSKPISDFCNLSITSEKFPDI